MSVYTTNDDELCCPVCGETNVHIDGITIDSDEPASLHVGVGLGKRIGLTGSCEHCTERFALLFTGYKGVTYLESARIEAVVDVRRQAS